MTATHRILQRQLRRSTRPDGSVDLEALLALVSRTYAEDEDDNRRTDRSIQLMVDELDAANASLSHATGQLQLTLESIQHGIMMINARGRIDVCNAKARELLGLPEEIAVGAAFADLAVWLTRFELVQEAAAAATISVGGDRFIDIHVRPTAQQGSVVVIEDVSADRRRERALRQTESEYRSLFENSVHGIYRDTLDGRSVRVNPALAALNGYAGEQEQIDDVGHHSGDWYVEPGRYAEFQRLLERDGRVKDFVSEVRRHKTGQRVWITENAWYVRDADGHPLFVEGTIQDASERIAAHEAMTRLANVDGLTGAKSRFRFMQRLDEEVAKTGRSFVLYCIDLDMFKDVNDVFGHAAGDAVLKAVSERLSALVGPRDAVARLGGDEFAILSSGPANVDEPERLARLIVEAMRVAVSVDGRDHYVGASVGIATFPAHGGSSEELLKNADTALYEVKSSGRNDWRLFDRELRASLENRKRLEDGLRTALDRGEIDLHFQPIVRAAGGLVAFEGLMRWTHPQFGRVPPSEFIPIAEQSGLMSDLGAFAITRACEAARAIPAPLKVGVNVSVNQFRMPGFLAHVESELKRCSVEPQRLTLEITESVLVESQKVARGLLADLRRIGVRIAIDDFGTGYSSLSYLQHFPINVVKIDRSFVAGMSSQKANISVIRAIIGIGKDLGIQIVAEGIETEDQAAALRAEGCDLLQGYLFGRPKPLPEATADLALELLRPYRAPEPRHGGAAKRSVHNL
jgi:diguanylate cyclase (GGDEF)-like protein/PAS domain S-box-containing protein